MSMQEKMRRMELTTFKRPAAVQMSLTDESLQDEIKQLIREGNVDSIVYHEKDCGVKASYTVTYKKADKNSKYTTYEFLFLTNKIT